MCVRACDFQCQLFWKGSNTMAMPIFVQIKSHTMRRGVRVPFQSFSTRKDIVLLICLYRLPKCDVYYPAYGFYSYLKSEKTKQIKRTTTAAAATAATVANHSRLEYQPNNIKPNCDLCEPLNLFKPPTYHTALVLQCCDRLMCGHHSMFLALCHSVSWKVR